MPILNIKYETIGLGGVKPRIIYITTNDTLAQVLAPGYLTPNTNLSISQTDIALVITRTTPTAQTAQVGIFKVGFSNNVWSLIPVSTVSSTANHIATYLDNIGHITQDAAVALTNGSITALGNIIAGSNGTAGTLSSFAPSAASGSLSLACSNNSSNATLGIQTNAHGQSTTYTITDVRTTAGSILNTAIANADISPNFITFNTLVTADALRSGGVVVLGGTAGGGRVYKVRELWINKGTPFVGGDRSLQIIDSSFITEIGFASTSLLLSLTNASWGSSLFRYPIGTPMSVSLPAGTNLVCRYASGTTDYITGGQTIVSGILQRVT